MKKILILEDDQSLRETLIECLKPLACCTGVASLSAAYQACDQEDFALVVVDRVLPDGDGLEFIEYLHELQFQTKVLALTELGKVHERITGLEKGADEYLPKPFSLLELKLKVKKLLHTDKLLSDDAVQIGTLTFYPGKGMLSFQGREIKLRKREAAIMHCLLRHRNTTVTREMIIDDVWSGSDIYPTQTTLDVYIRRIRVLLDDKSQLISTIRGFGYRFNDSMVAHR